MSPLFIRLFVLYGWLMSIGFIQAEPTLKLCGSMSKGVPATLLVTPARETILIDSGNPVAVIRNGS